MTITTLTAGGHITKAQQAELVAFCERHGQDPVEVLGIAVEQSGAFTDPTVTFTLYDRTADGLIKAEDGQPATYQEAVDLVGELPSCWDTLAKVST